MKKIIIAIGIVLLGFTACKQENKLATDYNETMKEALAAHDAVMPKMGTLGMLREDIKKKAASDTITANQERYQEAIGKLEEAHHLMMNWMKDFSNEFPNALSKEVLSDDVYKEKLPLLKEQAEKAEEMKNAINSSIKNAQELLKK